MNNSINDLIEVYIKDSNLKAAIQEIVSPFDISTEDKISLLNTIDRLIARRKVKDLYETKRVNEVIYAAAFIYDLYVVNNLISSILYLREKTSCIFDKLNVQENIRDYVLEICEAYQGEDTEIIQFMPQKGSPHDLFADAIFINNLLNRKSRL